MLLLKYNHHITKVPVSVPNVISLPGGAPISLYALASLRMCADFKLFSLSGYDYKSVKDITGVTNELKINPINLFICITKDKITLKSLLAN